ncbi:MAG: chemotaxis protein CheD [Longimicrobiales bacterium]
MSGRRLHVRVGELRVVDQGATLFTPGIGSCVAVALRDRTAPIGGLAHALLPEPRTAAEPERAGRYVTTAVRATIERLEGAGVDPARLVAWIAGGATMFRGLAGSGPSIGDRNVAAARATLTAAGIPILGEAVGGEFGRSLQFDVAAGTVRVSTALRGHVILGL